MPAPGSLSGGGHDGPRADAAWWRAGLGNTGNAA